MNIDLLKNKIEKGQDVDIKAINVEELEEIAEIKINTNKSSMERILEFLEKCRNPYLFRVGNNWVRVKFSNKNIYADNCVANVFKHIYE